MKKLQRLLVCSLILNLTFFVLSGLFVYRRGGVPYLISKVASSPQPVAPPAKLAAPPAKYSETFLYSGRKDTYAKLPRRDAAIVFAGDSITDLCAWQELLQRPVLNRGIGGDTVEGLRLRMNEVLQHHPRQLFIMIGINDLLIGKTGDEVLAEYQKLIGEIRAATPQTRLFVQSILPINTALWTADLPPHLATDIVQLNKELSGMADGKRIIYVDVYSHLVGEANQLDRQYTSDGVHLNGTGYIKWRESLRPYISSSG